MNYTYSYWKNNENEKMQKSKRDEKNIMLETRIARNIELNKMKLLIIRISRSVPMKHLNASSGDKIIGSPRTLNDVFIRIGHPVIFLNSEIKE